MFLSPRSSYSVRHWRTLLATLALTTAGAHAQEQTAKLVKDANAAKQGLPAVIGWVEPAGPGVVFPMDTLTYGRELWVSDGTAKGTRLLKDIVPGTAASNPQQGTPFGTGASAKVAFLTQSGAYVTDSNNPPELDLWVTDGTAAGTVRVLESPLPLQLGNTNLRAGTTNGVFLEDSSLIENGRELFFSDGTAAGSRSLNPLVEGARKFKNPENFTTSGSWCYFTANEEEVWRSDGTTAGTTKVATFTDLYPQAVHLIGDTLFVNVVVQAGVSSALWKVPAGGGTPTRVAPPTGTTWRYIRSMSSAGDDLVFTIQDSAGKPALWATDGTEAGTRRIPLTLPGQTVESQNGYSLTQWGNAVYLAASHTAVASAVWRTDGTPAGTTALKTVKPPYGITDGMLAGPDGVFYLTSTERGYQLWRTDGTAAGTRALKGTPLIIPSAAAPIITPTASTVYLLSGQSTSDEFLVRMKNSKGGSLQLTRPERINGSGITSHPVGAPSYQMRNGNMLQFVNTGRGQELWQIDLAKGKSRSLFKLSLALKPGGTLGFHGTTPAGDLFSRFGGDTLGQVFVTNGLSRGTKVLTADPAAVGFTFAKVGEQWFYSPDYPFGVLPGVILKTDGTQPGTTTIATSDGTQPKRLGNIAPFQGALYFISPSADGKKQALWRTDGTPAGTVRVADTWYGDATESITNLSAAGGKLYFSVLHGGKQHLWQSDGTAAGTVEVSSSTTFAAVINPAVDLAGVPVIQARLTASDSIQWWTIGSGTITRIESPAIDTVGASASSFPKYAVAGSQLFFSATSAGDTELWVTNGTTAGTHRVKDINPGPQGSRPAGMVAVGNYVHFIASHEDHGRELWRSDGTDAGTILAADVEPGPVSSFPYGLKAMDGRLYFSAERRTTGRELYSVDVPQ